ncbi:RNA polymerase II C-terminal domain phosphatase-like 3 isoform X1 [Arachis ipaensis]|uniref:RNA polymerase II C-terminal domain phosphatase-like 3 isoform X1 n=1 Tax=Arachis ipaensis TaxID=130454 RepID=UPI0007AF484A|nr:RNA polymerase II C-terminal domain phosphatase-like 3 isoform X1 [Arachis ipaensis]XP_020974806.1 RNA polymerase II C-terminal domain phosphatase-like 3 isoform X1 [Arachis ipaensis]
MSSNQSSSGSAGVKENASEVVIVDDDKEEGELEEGEIDDDGTDPEASVTKRVQSVAKCGVVASDTDSTSHKLSVREVLEGVTVANVEESFEGTCSTHGAIRNDFTDLTSPHTWYPQARKKHRRIILHVGPTNSGKMHQALKQLESSDSGNSIFTV